MVDVFISYTRVERGKVELIRRKLEGLGLDLFFDLENIDGGVAFPDIIDRALRTSKAVLCCWSPRYFERPWCLIECRNGDAREIMVPIALSAFDRFAPPADLQGKNYFNLADWDGSDAHEDWNRALVSIGKHIGRDLVSQVRPDAAGAGATHASSSAQARADILADLRATWVGFPARGDNGAVEKFLGRVRAVAPGSGLEFEVEHHLDEIRRKAGAPAGADEDPRRHEDARRRLGPTAMRARDAALASRPVAERTFRIELPGVADWPEPEVVAVPPGRAVMGAPADEDRGAAYDGREDPSHAIAIDYVFAVGRSAVTMREFAAFVAATNRDMGKSAYILNAAGEWVDTPDRGWRDPGYVQSSDHPVTCVSWYDARDYLEWLNSTLGVDERAGRYRLLTEAEWEYACRAGTTTPFSFGHTISTAQANYDGRYAYGGGPTGEYRERTTPVGSFPANAFGLCDMHGNVWEWCQDVWNKSYAEPGRPDDGSAWLTGENARVRRGGCWYNNPPYLRSAYRIKDHPAIRSQNTGFRLARTLRA